MAKEDYSLKLLAGEAKEADIKASIEKILKDTPLLTFATVGDDNMPHVSNSYYGYSPSLQLISLTSPASNHIKNITRNPQVAVSITNTMQLPTSKKTGLELIGTMRQAKGFEATKAYAQYLKKIIGMPKAKDGGGGPKLSKMMTSKPYIIDVSIVKVLDEGKFGGDVMIVAEVSR